MSFSKKEIVIASSNNGKLAEFETFFQPLGIKLIPQRDLGIDDIEETGKTYIENAILKARNASKLSGLPAIADDSGLSVDFLNGQPGIFSARFSGPDCNDSENRALLLRQLKGVPYKQRKAKYHAMIVLLQHHQDPCPLISEGSWQGVIAEEEKGKLGFGYDSIFMIPELTCHAAEIEITEKEKYSHRGQALRKLSKILSNLNVDA